MISPTKHVLLSIFIASQKMIITITVVIIIKRLIDKNVSSVKVDARFRFKKKPHSVRYYT